MSKTVQIASTAEFNALLKSSKVVVADFYADWCGPCKAIAPIFETLSNKLYKKDLITFAKINTETHGELAAEYSITSLPTFMVFKDGYEAEKVVGANAPKLQEVVKDLDKISKEGGVSSSGSGSSGWTGAPLPKGYSNVTDQVDYRGLELLNSDQDYGGARTLFEASKPSTLDNKSSTAKDWVESDTDEQLMLYIPFQTTLKIHTIHITSIAPSVADDEDDDEIPMRPKTVKLYTNKSHILGFDEADDIETTQTVELKKEDWDSNGTASISLRFVKFQNVSSLVIFVVDGDRAGGEKTRVDRIRIIGELGEKREMGKLEKIGDEPGE